MYTGQINLPHSNAWNENFHLNLSYYIIQITTIGITFANNAIRLKNLEAAPTNDLVIYYIDCLFQNISLNLIHYAFIQGIL